MARQGKSLTVHCAHAMVRLMTLTEHLAAAKRGECARLARVSGLDYTTIWRIAHRGYRLVNYTKARSLSDATGGAVSIAELCAAPPETEAAE
jgi:hypothetical protein